MKQSLKVLYLLLLFAISSHVHGETSIDTSGILFKEIWGLYPQARGNPEYCLRSVDSLFQYINKSGEPHLQGIAWYIKGYSFQFLNNADSSVYYLKKAEQYFEENGLRKYQLYTQLDLSLVLTKQLKYTESLKVLIKADSINRNIQDNERGAQIMRMLGAVYRELKDFDRAEEYFLKALDLYWNMEDMERYVGVGGSLAILYRYQEKYDSSLALMMEIARISQEVGLGSYSIAYNHEGIGDSFLGLAEINEQMNLADSALFHYWKAYRYFEELQDTVDMSYELFEIGRALKLRGDYREAEKHLLQAWDLAVISNMQSYAYDIYPVLHDVYYKMGDFSQAYDYLIKDTELTDSFLERAQREKTNEIKERYESEKKEQEIALLLASKELTLAEKERMRLLQYVLIFMMLGISVTTFFIFNRAKHKRKLEALKLRSRLASNLHEDVGTALSAIDVNSRLAMLDLSNTKNIENQLAEIRSQASSSLESMRNLVWSVKPGNDTVFDLVAYMKEYTVDLCDFHNIDLNYEEGITEKTIITPEMKSRMFFFYKNSLKTLLDISGIESLDVKVNVIIGENYAISISAEGQYDNKQILESDDRFKLLQMQAKKMAATFSCSAKSGAGIELRLEKHNRHKRLRL